MPKIGGKKKKQKNASLIRVFYFIRTDDTFFHIFGLKSVFDFRTDDGVSD